MYFLIIREMYNKKYLFFIIKKVYNDNKHFLIYENVCCHYIQDDV